MTGLIELTGLQSGDPIALNIEMIGTVKPCSGVGAVGTFIQHKTNCRRHWTVREAYGTVMERIRAATTPGTTGGPA
ncbi:MAG: hypothetical protein AMXMBFR13_30630 [Phycisphaerae bacterium]